MDNIKLPIILRKPKGRQYIHIDVDHEMSDDWFIRISYRKNKTGEEVRSECIIRKDLKNWLSGSLKLYTIQNEET